MFLHKYAYPLHLMESDFYIDGGTFNRCFTYDFSCLFLVLPPFVSGVAWRVCHFLLTSSIDPNWYLFLAFWTKPLEDGPSFFIYGHSSFFCILMRTKVHWLYLSMERKLLNFPEKKKICPFNWSPLAISCHLLTADIEFKSLSSCYPFKMQVKSESCLKMKYPRTESCAVG